MSQLPQGVVDGGQTARRRQRGLEGLYSIGLRAGRAHVGEGGAQRGCTGRRCAEHGVHAAARHQAQLGASDPPGEDERGQRQQIRRIADDAGVASQQRQRGGHRVRRCRAQLGGGEDGARRGDRQREAARMQAGIDRRREPRQQPQRAADRS
jgi:hypothetical protein